MKIVSKFTDYYDSVGKKFQGVPNQQLWLREELEISNSNLIDKILSELQLKDSLHRYRYWRKNNEEIIYEPYGLVVAGELYPLIRITKKTLIDINKKTLISLSEIICHTLSEVMSECVDRVSKHQVRDWYDFFSKKGHTLSIDLCNTVQSPVILLKNKSIYFSRYRPNITLIVNPSLKDLEFYRVKDPFTCYQEIDQFLTKLTSPEKEYPQVEDIYRLVEHGFDKKVSFRKRKLG